VGSSRPQYSRPGPGPDLACECAHCVSKVRVRVERPRLDVQRDSLAGAEPQSEHYAIRSAEWLFTVAMTGPTAVLISAQRSATNNVPQRGGGLYCRNHLCYRLGP
jgi:hypothetical protein